MQDETQKDRLQKEQPQQDKLKDNWRGRILLFLISQCITLFGSTLVQMAIVWYVTLNTNSGVWVAVFSVCSYLPQFLISFIGGVWADRYSRKKLIIGADAAIAGVTLVMALMLPHMEELPLMLSGLLVMSVIRSIGAGIQTPAVNAVVPQLVPEPELMRYNGINAVMQSAVQFAAPAAAGVVLTTGTLPSTLLIDILTAVLGIGLVSCVRIPWQKSGQGGRQENVQESGQGSRQGSEQGRRSVLEDMGIGIRYAFANRNIGKLLVIYGLFTFLCVPAGFLAGLLVSRVYGDTYWYLTAVELAGFGGMVAGGLLMGAWGGFRSRLKTLCIGLAVFGLAAAGMGVSWSFGPYLMLMALYGVALTSVQTTLTTMLQEQSDAAMQGRVFGLFASMYAGCYPIGMAVFGPLADLIPLQWIMIAAGAVLVLTAALIWRVLWAE